MGRELLAVVKALLTAIIVCGAAIASFYFAYLLLVFLILGGVGLLAYLYHSRDTISDWFEYEDSE